MPDPLLPAPAPDLAHFAATESDRLVAIVESSDDAIVSKDLDGTVLSWNKSAERLFGYAAKEAIGKSISLIIPPNLQHEEPIILERIRRGERVIGYETKRVRKDGSLVEISLTVSPVKDARGTIVGASKIARDITARRRTETLLRQQTRHFEILNHIAKVVSSELDLERVVQAVTDFATDLSGARFGAFFNSESGGRSERRVLYAFSGASREAFEKFGPPCNSPLFEPTFKGTGVVRSEDVRKDARYGEKGPYHGMSRGHLPVVSFLAVPVTSRSGEVLGGLFFGHELPGVFTQESERLVSGIAVHAAIAIDNARLHQAAQAEIEQRRRAEDTKQLLLNEIKHRVNNTLGVVQAIAMQTFSEATKAQRETFGARLRALANAHELLAGQDRQHASVGDLVRRAAEPFLERHRDRFQASGPEVALDAQKALSLALVLHELGTNAVKYGALSNDTGRVTVAWETSPGQLLLSWRESGGPRVTPPKRDGYGTRLINLALAGHGGTVQLEFPPSGAVCAVKLPL